MWTDDDSEQSCGFADPVSDFMLGLVVAFVLALIGVCMLAWDAGKMPLFGG